MFQTIVLINDDLFFFKFIFPSTSNALVRCKSSFFYKDTIIYIEAGFLSYYTLQIFKLTKSFHCRYRRQTHVTPKSYLSFLGGYQSIYNKKLHYFQNLARRMKTGLDKLIEATVSVDGLSKELVIKEKELEVANVKADTVRVIHCYHISFFNHSLSFLLYRLFVY